MIMKKEEDEENEERQSWRRRRRRQWWSDSCGGRHHQWLVELIRVALWFVVPTNGFGVYFLANASSMHIAKSCVSFIPPKILPLAQKPTLKWNFYAMFFLGFATNIICVINGNKKCFFPLQQTSSMDVYIFLDSSKWADDHSHVSCCFAVSGNAATSTPSTTSVSCNFPTPLIPKCILCVRLSFPVW